jgi:hypothetical protein
LGLIRSNNDSRAERLRWADYENFEEDIDDIDGDFDAIKLKIPTFQGKNDPKVYLE